MASADEEFIKQLREVFDLCDELKCGIISVNQLRDIVRKHFGGSEEEVVQLIECLDPNQHGVVTFADFCRGVQSTLQIKGVNFEEAALRSQQWERRGRRKLHLPGTFIPARQQLQETFLQCIGQSAPPQWQPQEFSEFGRVSAGRPHVHRRRRSRPQPEGQ
ncbi:unnamed protein product [Larinioides sclopetarius]|uniref:EF-hand domain-containing protein n=1 Tax=Larinioides sclopetarius TaxID=280406 RepID=A0AAV2B623_9ARAC